MRRRHLVATAAIAVLLAPLALPTPAQARGVPSGLIFQGADPRQDQNNSIYLADETGGHVREILTRVPGDLLHPEWSPDGRAIAFVVDGSAIWLAAADGSHPRRLLGADTGVDFPAWSPDGRSIAYTRYGAPSQSGPPTGSDIVIRDLVSGKDRAVAHSAPGQVLDVPRWSGDGSRLVVGIDRFDDQGFETGSAIAVVDVRSLALHRLTTFEDYAYSPDWNRCTGEIVFSRETIRFAENPPDVALDLSGIRPDGSGRRQITRVSGDRVLFQPAWTPDGRAIVATLDEPGARRGVRIDPMTGRITRLATPQTVMTHLKERP